MIIFLICLILALALHILVYNSVSDAPIDLFGVCTFIVIFSIIYCAVGYLLL
jgi:hypothetical protein